MKKNPLEKIINEGKEITDQTLTTLDKQYHQIAVKQIEAIGHLINTIKELDKQNQKLEQTNITLQKTTLLLSFVAIFFTLLQTIQSLFSLSSLENIFISFVITIITGYSLSKWFINK